MACRICASAVSRSCESLRENPATAAPKVPGLNGRNSKTHWTRSNSGALDSIFRDASARTGLPPERATTLDSVPGPAPRSRTSAPLSPPTAKDATSSLIALSEKREMRLEPFS